MLIRLGGVYPEKDLFKQPTLDKIFDYVQRQGLFVNVSDIPGYWAYNALVNKVTETTDPIWRPIEVTSETGEKVLELKSLRPFYEVPWMKRLGLNITPAHGKYTKGVKLRFVKEYMSYELADFIEVKIYRLVSSSESNVTTIVEPIKDRVFGKLTAMFFASYGDGKFLISLPHLASNQDTRTKNIIMDSIVDMVLVKLSNVLPSNKSRISD